MDLKGKIRPTDPRANYMGPECGPFMCKECEYFNGNNKPCEKISAPVKDYGCCNLFEPMD